MASAADPVPHTEAQHQKSVRDFIFISEKPAAVPTQKRTYRIKAQAALPPLCPLNVVDPRAGSCNSIEKISRFLS